MVGWWAEVSRVSYAVDNPFERADAFFEVWIEFEVDGTAVGFAKFESCGNFFAITARLAFGQFVFPLDFTNCTVQQDDLQDDGVWTWISETDGRRIEGAGEDIASDGPFEVFDAFFELRIKGQVEVTGAGWRLHDASLDSVAVATARTFHFEGFAEGAFFSGDEIECQADRLFSGAAKLVGFGVEVSGVQKSIDGPLSLFDAGLPEFFKLEGRGASFAKADVETIGHEFAIAFGLGESCFGIGRRGRGKFVSRKIKAE